MTRYYLAKANPDRGYYEVEESEGKFRWTWREIAKDGEAYVDHGKWVSSKADALRYAADDFDAAGNGDDRFIGRLRALATRVERGDD